MADRKTLCIADNTTEARAAVLFAAHRVARTDAQLTILRVIEPMDPGLWASMGERMRTELRQEALDDLQRLAEAARDTSGVEPELLVLEGELAAQIAVAVDRDPLIKTIVLASGTGRDGPGPLVAAATRGTFTFGERHVALMIVPGSLSDAQAAELAA
jgi:nucleotide-binding universal stress UspA family protein